MKSLQSEGISSAQRLAAAFDQAGHTAFLEADLLSGVGITVVATGEASREAGCGNAGERLIRRAIFSFANGRHGASFDLFARAIQAVAPEVALGWAQWLATELQSRAAAIALLNALATGLPNDARTQWQIACIVAEWPDEFSRKLRQTTLSRAWQVNPAVDPALPVQFVLDRRFAGDWDTVEKVCAAQLAIDPGHTEFAWQLACAQWRRYDPVAAEKTMRRVDAVLPRNSAVLTAIAQFVAEQARYGAAQRLYQRALELDPSSVTPAVDLAELELREGDWRRGWARYEARLRRTDRADRSVVVVMARVAPLWTGQPLAGRTLLIYSEQGNGDDIQMMRFIPALAARVSKEGGQLVLVCRRGLYPLFARHYQPCIELESGAFAQYGGPDYCLPIMSVPFVLRLTPDQVRGAPYLKADAAGIAAWRSHVRERTPRPEARQIGLVWRGSPTHRRDAQRSIPLEQLAPLFAVPGIVFHPLTPGGVALPENVPHCDLTGDYRRGFEDVASHVSALDAVVTIDSAPLHLGGALGAPVYAMLDHVSHWAWGTAETQRWYESVTLFRQPRPGDWEPVVKRVAAVLARLNAPAVPL
ncbi:hypothetical protein [Paraburkholderia sp. J76]|uniref:tetratricopeptide repeat protein n=1 Tax=Paraburkholderia sp. J76 TaxID=2805439 RepID=UPI002ABD8CAC|nr:hypothetical protein [Paraburkholderia sp. J76]